MGTPGEHPLLRRLRAGRPVAGERLAGYELVEEVARGGQGYVLRARHAGLALAVALKVHDPQGGAASPERFREEARVLARLRHPNLVRVIDLGEEPGLLFLAEDLVEGPTLEEVVCEQLPPPAWSARVAAELADALAHCHAAGLVHRDVKPPNVVLDRGRAGEQDPGGAYGRPVLVDFGLVKRDPEASGFASLEELGLSRSHEVKGSPEFMSPEQADPDGERGPVGPAADLFGLGGTLYYLLTGQPPFGGSTSASTLGEVLRVTPTRPRQLNPEVPAWLDELCMQALHKDPARRPASATAFASALRAGGGAGAGAGAGASDAAEEAAARAPLDARVRGNKGASGRRRRPASERDDDAPPRRKPARASRVPNALVLESGEELPAYRPPPRRALGAAPFEPAGTGPVWAMALAIVLVFVAAGVVTGQAGAGAGAGVFLAGVLPCVLWFAVWARGSRRAARRARRAERRARAEPSEALARARAALEERDAGAALAAAEQALGARHDDAEALALRGAARARRGEQAAGLLDLDAALALDPALAPAYAERGALRFALGDLEGARADFDALIGLRPDDAEAFANRGACHYKARDYPRAIDDFDRCLELHPDDLELLRRRGRARFKARDFAGAAEDWGRILALHPEDLDALRKRAVAYRRSGREREARRDEERLAALEGEVALAEEEP
ncbi:MAG: protein kinase [Planctomycetota bacterium]